MKIRAGQQGFTLVEAIVSIVLIGLALAGILLAFTSSVSGSSDPLIGEQSVAIAESYMEEIVSRHFNDPDGVDGEASRSAYDDVDDYDGLSQEPQLPDGTTLGLSAYTVDVAVSTAALGSITAGSGDALRIDVTVTHVSGRSVNLTGYRADYGP